MMRELSYYVQKVTGTNEDGNIQDQEDQGRQGNRE